MAYPIDPSGPRTRYFIMRLTPGEHAGLTAAAVDRGVPVSELVRRHLGPLLASGAPSPPPGEPAP